MNDARIAKRQRAERRGRRAEWMAALAYGLRGHQILARRFKTPGGEIDLVVRRRQTLVFVEVKARQDHNAAILAVTPAARRRIEQAGRYYLSLHPALAEFAVRYDIAVIAGLRVRIVRDAWRAR